MSQENHGAAEWVEQAGLDPTLLVLNAEEFLHPWRQRAKWLGSCIIDCLATQHGTVTPFGMFMVPRWPQSDHSSDS